jgi:hypothetical protein
MREQKSLLALCPGLVIAIINYERGNKPSCEKP